MTKCKKCGGAINWIKKDGRWYGLNHDGSEHWDVCSANRWRQVVQTGERFDDEDGFSSGGARATISGYRKSKHGDKLMQAVVKPIRGRNYIDVQCDCGIPPWESCKHSF